MGGVYVLASALSIPLSSVSLIGLVSSFPVHPSCLVVPPGVGTGLNPISGPIHQAMLAGMGPPVALLLYWSPLLCCINVLAGGDLMAGTGRLLVGLVAMLVGLGLVAGLGWTWI